MVDRVARRAIKARGKYITLALRRDLPHGIAKVGDIDIAYKIDRYTADSVALNNIGKRTDFNLRAHRNSRKEQRQYKQ